MFLLNVGNIVEVLTFNRIFVKLDRLLCNYSLPSIMIVYVSSLGDIKACWPLTEQL